jgi:DNA modification methylase
MSSPQVDPRNRLNDLDSSRWLQFQKSWFLLTRETPAEFIQFFTKQRSEAGQSSRVGIFPENAEVFQPVIESLGREAILLNDALLALPHRSESEREGERETLPLTSEAGQSDVTPELDYVLIDLCKIFTDEESYFRQGPRWLDRIHATAGLMKPNSYLTIFLRNWEAKTQRVPFAWEFGKLAGSFLTMKDEKIGCITGHADVMDEHGHTDLMDEHGQFGHADSTGEHGRSKWVSATNHVGKSGPTVIYCLNFRRESPPVAPPPQLVEANDFQTTTNHCSDLSREDERTWFVVKPPPREKNVLLHPAKFPEPLIQEFVDRYSRPGERVFDPMAGTGSALVAALSCQREAYGIELNPAFCEVIRQRLKSRDTGPSLFDQSAMPHWQLCCGDAGAAETYNELPAPFHYVITSPPYWDMLRMKGAETQQKRKQAGLLQFYSDDERDLGNIAGYENFLESLAKIYRFVGSRLAPGRYMTIIVKNVKKKGQIFPLAWDLALRLRRDFTICREQFWCQDDQKLAPFGYRYAWVSNTFHHYCLHFSKPGLR